MMEIKNKEVNSVLLGLLSRIEQIKDEVNQSRASVDRLTQQARQIEIELSDFSKAREEEAINSAYNNFAMGKITEEELMLVRERDPNEERKHKEKLLKAIGTAKQDATRRIIEKSTLLGQAKDEVWRHVCSKLSAQLPDDLILKLTKVWAASFEAHDANSYDQFMRAIFPQPSIDDINKTRNALVREFGLEKVDL